jgi:ABC-type Zn uptake system ZnuABC Zn-binding protein ZnuA
MRLSITNWKAISLVLALAAVLVLAACSDDDDDADAGDARLRVVTTIPVFADFVEQVGGERVQVTSLLPPGADPHTFEPAPRDVQYVAEADIAFVNGLDLEPSAIRVVRANLPSGAIFVELAEEAVAAGVHVADRDDDHADDHADDDHADDDHDDHADDDHGHAHDEGDPHLWMDIHNGAVYVAIIRDTLSEADPEGAEYYQANYEAYLEELEETEEYMEERVAGIPAERRKLITTHDAFGYLADHLGFEVIAFVSAGPGQEPSPEDIANIIREIEHEGVPAVFVEPQISGDSNILERAAGDAGVEVCKLYSDSLDDRVTTYIEMMRFNSDELARCLGTG